LDNNNVGDIINKFNNILKDKDIDIGKILGDEEESTPLDFNFDLDTILKFKNIFNKVNNNNNPRNTLLNSLKPYLRENRKKKLDQYIKIANLLGVLAILNKDSDEKNDANNIS
jgi:hypothetical protein